MGGATYERELVNTLDGCGWSAMRAPSSGSATTRDLPDVLAMRVGAERTNSTGILAEVLAVELKTTSKPSVYVTADEVEALERFADTAGANALLGARFKRNGHDRVHYLVPPERAGRTQGDESGNYSVHIDEAEDVAAWLVNATKREVTRL